MLPPCNITSSERTKTLTLFFGRCHMNTQGIAFFTSFANFSTPAFKYFQGDDQTDKVSSQLEQLRLSSVEREFRKRIAEYHGGNGMSGNCDSGSVSDYL